MDFDEFAMWIMNSEFQPSLKNRKRGAVDKVTAAIQGIHHLLKHREGSFRTKRNLSFTEFLSEMSRLEIDADDNDFRALFMAFDVDETGFIESDRIHHWINSGVIEPRVRHDKFSANNLPSLQTIINKLGAQNTKHIEQCFLHIPEGKGIRMKIDEFRSCLLAFGLGKHIDDVHHLFYYVGRDPNVIDMDELRKIFAPLPIETSFDEVSGKKIVPSTIRSSRADRFLRDAIRKSFPSVREDIAIADPDSTGYITSEDLHKIIVRRCMPLTFQDFRFILQQVTRITAVEVSHKHVFP